MRRIRLFWHDREAGTIPVPDSYRPPITQRELDAIPAMLIVRSRSWLFDVRAGDVRLELRSAENREEVVAVADRRLGPGDIGCIVGFEPASDRDDLRPDEELLGIADSIFRQQASERSRT